MVVSDTKAKIKAKSGRRGLSRIELVLLLILLALGFTLRIWDISSVGLDHFDEGVYAFSALGLTDSNQPHRLYPGQFRFSPPVFFALVGFSHWILRGALDTAAVIVNVLLGTLTIGVVWWIGRKWFSPQVGIAAAAFLALSEYHIGLSRTALTDVSFAFFFLLALVAIVGAFQHGSAGLAIIAGLAAGLAWNTKYHGWFALLIAGLALLPYAWVRRTDRSFVRRSLFLLGITIVVAIICYLPWALYIQSQPGGYPAFSAYQATMLSPHWFRNAWWHAQNQFFFEGWLSRISVSIAFLCISLVPLQSGRVTLKFLLMLLFLSSSTLLIGSQGTAALLTLVGIPLLLRKHAAYSSWLVFGWLVIWFFTAPLYRPYARLLLPFNIATYFVASVWMFTKMDNQPTEGRKPVAWRPICAAVSTVFVVIIAFSIPSPSNPWRPSRGAFEATLTMGKAIPAGERVIVIGEPSLAFYLHLDHRPAFERIEDIALLDSIKTPVYIVTGVYATRAPTLREGLKKLNDRLVPLGKVPMNPKDIRILDDFAPQDARLYCRRPDTTYDLKLYRLLPKS